jgi:hypothetical protein
MIAATLRAVLDIEACETGSGAAQNGHAVS